ncbi:MAG: hypothetical protein R3E96_08475 [Planctomycetota bacterium]
MRLSYLPLLAAASIACHSTEPKQELTQQAAQAAEQVQSAAAVRANTADAAVTQATLPPVGIQVEASQPSALAQGSGDMADQAQRAALLKQQGKHLAERLVEEGNTLVQRADFQNALLSFRAPSSWIPPARPPATACVRPCRCWVIPSRPPARPSKAKSTA